MTEPKTTSIRIEPLNPAHLAQWVQDAPIDQVSRFQGFLIGDGSPESSNAFLICSPAVRPVA